MVKVLIVEDDPMVAKINKNYVESVDGFKVAGVASNGQEAISFLEKGEIDLVILDIYLPNRDGIFILEQIRKNQVKCDVIMVTASAEVEKIDASLKLGVIDYLIKPFEYERLKMSLENYLSRCNTLRTSNKIKQEDLDRFLISVSGSNDNSIPKGLNRYTLSRVISFLEKIGDKLLSAEEISEGLGITKVTVRRYMDYLEKIGFVVREAEYGFVGRPYYIYKKIDN